MYTNIRAYLPFLRFQSGVKESKRAFVSSAMDGAAALVTLSRRYASEVLSMTPGQAALLGIRAMQYKSMNYR